MPASRVCPECGLSTDETRCPKDGRVTMSAALLEANEDPWLGRLVGGKVRIEACIGRGGMGAVYRARHLETDGLVAVKVLHPQAAERAQILRRFHLEAQNAASLRSVYTIRVIDYGVDGGTPFLIMEHLDGLPLSTVLRNEGRLPWRRALHIAAQIAKSLWEAHDHERRIIHRDIKPGNIFLLDQYGARDFVKVLDFGISRSLEGGGADTRGPIGTPHAMAPEQWAGREIDGRADIYALGCLLYEMIAGAPPFDVDPTMSPTAQMAHLARAHTSKPPPPFDEEVQIGLPRGLETVISSMLAKRPEDRPATARDIVERFEALLSGESGALAALPVGKPFKQTLAHRRASAVRPGPPGLASDDFADAVDDPATLDSPASLGGDDGRPSPLFDSRATHDAFEQIEAAEAAVAAAHADSERSFAATTAVGGRRRLWPFVAGGVLALALAIGLGFWLSRPPDEATLRASLADKAVAVPVRQEALDYLLRQQGAGPRLRGLQLSGLRLNSTSLVEADLQGADLEQVDLTRADLARADLRRASLVGANLRGANLRGADLRAADLDGAVLAGTQLAGSRYDGDTRWPEGFDATRTGSFGPNAQFDPKAEIGNVDLRGADLRGASLTDANLKGGRLADANLGGGNLRGANLQLAELRRAVLRDVDLRGADLRGADLRGAMLEGADLRGARYDRETRWPEGFAFLTSGAVGPAAKLARADLSGADLQGVDLRGADLERARLLGTDLRGARLAQARLANAMYDDKTRWPDGFDAVAAGAVRRGADAEPLDEDEPALGVPAAAAPGADASQAPEAVADGADVTSAPAVVAPAAVAVAAADDGAAGAAPAARPRAPTHADPTPARTPKTTVTADPAAGPTLKPPPAPRVPAPVVAEPALPPPAPQPSAPQPSAPTQPAETPPTPAGPTLKPPPAPHPSHDFADMDLRGVDLQGVDLSGRNLRLARYDKRTRWPAGFDPRTSGAVGPGAKLAGVVLRSFPLNGMDLRGADLQRADLRGGKLVGARLDGADLRGALLHGADLRGARTAGAQWQGARFDSATRWPDGFEAADHGATLDF